MSYLIILVVLIIILILLFKLFNKEILSPSIVYVVSMIGCLICSIIGLINWNNVKQLKLTTILIILMSVVFFIIGELIIRKILKENSKKIELRKLKEIEGWKILIQIIFVIITIILMYFEVKRIAKISGYKDGNLAIMIGFFRNMSTLYTTELIEKGQGINIIVSQMRKICEVMCFVNMYFLINNIFYKRIKNKKNIGYLLIVILCFILSLLTGGRMQMIIYIVAALFLTLFFMLSKYNYKQILRKHLKKIVVFIIVVTVGFYGMLPLTGRKNNVDIISYMSFYLGTSIPSLDIYLDKPTEVNYFGEETFKGLQTVLYKFGINDNIKPITTEWIQFSVKDENIMASNVFTSGKRYYHDFGYLGVAICQLFFGMTMSFIYYMTKKKSNVVLLIFLSMNYYMIIDQIRDDLFYSNFVHINSIFYLVVLFIGYNFLTKFDFKKIKKYIKRNIHENI